MYVCTYVHTYNYIDYDVLHLWRSGKDEWLPPPIKSRKGFQIQPSGVPKPRLSRPLRV